MDATSEIQVNAGTIIFPPLGNFSFKIDKDIKFAEEPEFTKTEYFTPNQLDHSSSNFFTRKK